MPRCSRRVLGLSSPQTSNDKVYPWSGSIDTNTVGNRHVLPRRGGCTRFAHTIAESAPPERRLDVKSSTKMGDGGVRAGGDHLPAIWITTHDSFRLKVDLFRYLQKASLPWISFKIPHGLLDVGATGSKNLLSVSHGRKSLSSHTLQTVAAVTHGHDTWS